MSELGELTYGQRNVDLSAYVPPASDTTVKVGESIMKHHAHYELREYSLILTSLYGMNQRTNQIKPIFKISVDSNFTFSSYMHDHVHFIAPIDYCVA